VRIAQDKFGFNVWRMWQEAEQVVGV
jgi:hypothetical protein